MSEKRAVWKEVSSSVSKRGRQSRGTWRGSLEGGARRGRGRDGRGRRLASRPRLPRPPYSAAAAVAAAQGGRAGVGSSCGSPHRPLAEAPPGEPEPEPEHAGSSRRGGTGPRESSRRQRRDAGQRHGAHRGPDLFRPGPAPPLQEKGEGRGRCGGGGALPGARLGGRGLPRGRPRPARFAGSLPPFPAARSPDFPAPFGLTGMGRGAWELGPRGSETSSSPPGWEQRQARAHRLSSVPRRQGLLDDRRSAALSARERSPRGARREGIPPPALSCPGRSASQLPKLKCSRRASPAVGAFGLGAVRGRSVDRRQTPLPGFSRPLLRALPQ